MTNQSYVSDVRQFGRQLKRVTLIIGFGQDGKPMSLGISSNDQREIYILDYSVVVLNKQGDETIVVQYSMDKFMAIEYIEKVPEFKKFEFPASPAIDVA